MAQTSVIANAPGRSGVVTAVGLYGNALRVGYGSRGGWDPFGPRRVVTRSEANVLFELDNQSALALYKRYLGDHAQGLPATALLFPLEIVAPGRPTPVVRTILGVDEARGSLTFAGDVPVGSTAQLMKANFDRLVDGAFDAGRMTSLRDAGQPEAALLVSCVGRRMVLRQRVEEELESVRDALGSAVLFGFYSYGELCPSGQLTCELHNQTMTVTTFREAA
jgi:hypothetical protein